ncbi:MAG: uroporphyrinogen decarboxylase family protein [Lentisphaeria bacterium]
MNSRERMIVTLKHRQPDRVPFDMGGCQVTGIHQVAYQNLSRALGMGNKPAPLADVYQQVVIPPEAFLEHLRVDVRGLYPLTSHNWNVRGTSTSEGLEFTDEWGFVQRFPNGGFWWSQVKSPLDGPDIDPDKLRAYTWPQAALSERIAGLRKQALKQREAGYIVMLKGFCAGAFEMGQRIRGMENFLCDVLTDPIGASKVLDKVNRLKMEFWDMALEELGDVVDIVVETDDYGTQDSQLISPELFRTMLKPRLAELFALIKRKLAVKKPAGEQGWLFFHSCGNVRPLLPDFIEIGVDILNPVHITATGMNPKALKRDFGTDVTFWGGGIETQSVLPRGTLQQVREDVKRNLETLMPGGGYVFNTVHNIQADVPPENIIAMWETLQQFGIY